MRCYRLWLRDVETGGAAGRVEQTSTRRRSGRRLRLHRGRKVLRLEGASPQQCLGRRRGRRIRIAEQGETLRLEQTRARLRAVSGRERWRERTEYEICKDIVICRGRRNALSKKSSPIESRSTPSTVNRAARSK
jgi:hypothetical protein